MHKRKPISKRKKNVVKSLELNYIFYATAIVCLILLSYCKNINVIWAILTFIIMSFLGYITHIISHSINFKYYYTKLNAPNPVLKYIVDVLDFHADTHHDSTINKQVSNSIHEFIGNFITQAGIILICKFFLTHFDTSIIILWGLIYSTVHMINYTIVENDTHKKHHMNKYTNYGLDIYDILFNTKYDSVIDDINHYSINMILLTFIIIAL
jgi:hypothetical protein